MRLTIKMRKPRGNPFEMLGQNKKSSINANPSLFGRLYEMPRLYKYPYTHGLWQHMSFSNATPSEMWGLQTKSNINSW